MSSLLTTESFRFCMERIREELDGAPTTNIGFGFNKPGWPFGMMFHSDLSIDAVRWGFACPGRLLIKRPGSDESIMFDGIKEFIAGTPLCISERFFDFASDNLYKAWVCSSQGARPIDLKEECFRSLLCDLDEVDIHSFDSDRHGILSHVKWSNG